MPIPARPTPTPTAGAPRAPRPARSAARTLAHALAHALARTLSRTALGVLALVLLGGASAWPDGEAPRAAPGAWRASEALAPDADTAGHDLLRVLDARTGRPVAGAQVTATWESAYEHGAWAPRDGRWTTDEHGTLVRRRPPGDEGSRHWEVRAPGYETEHEYSTGDLDETLELEPAVAMHGRLVDVAGRPLAGVTVAWKKGCAHAPFHGQAVSDATGRFVLPDGPRQADIGTIAGPGIRFDPYNVEVAPLGVVAPLTVVEPGITVRGRVLPPHGPHVLTLASRQEERGPLLELAPHGGFCLPHVEPGSELQVWDLLLPGTGPEPVDATPLRIDLDAWTPGACVQAGAREPAWDAVRPGRLHLFAVGAAAGDDEALLVHLDRSDGRRMTATLHLDDGEDGAAQALELPPGCWRVRLSGGPFARYVAQPLVLQVPATPSTQRRALVLSSADRVLVPAGDARLAAALGVGVDDLETMAWHLAARDSLSGALVHLQGHLGPEAQAGLPWVLPGVPVSLWAYGPFGRVQFLPARGPAGERRFTWSVQPGGVLEVEGGPEGAAPGADDFSIADGIPLHAQVLANDAGGKGRVRLRVPEPGPCLVYASLRPHWRLAVLPFAAFAPAAAPPRVAFEQLWPQAGPQQQLRLEPPPEVPLPSEDPATAMLLRLCAPQDLASIERAPGYGAQLGWEADEPMLDEGRLDVRHPLLRPGTHVLAQLDVALVQDAEDAWQPSGWALAPLHAVLQGPGPYALAWPRGGLDLRVRLAQDGEGEPTVRVDGQDYPPRALGSGEFLLRLRGLPAGRHHVTLLAAGHTSQATEVTLAPDEVRALEGALPAAQPEAAPR